MAGVAALINQRNALVSAGQLFPHLRWAWVGIAAVFEGLSIVALAELNRRLLRAGGIRSGVRAMTEATLAANALSVSLPGGVAVAAPWFFNQLRRRGADGARAGWVVVTSGALSAFALFVILIAAIELGGSHGPTAALRPVVLGFAFAVPLGLAVVAAVRRRSGLSRLRHRLPARLALSGALPTWVGRAWNGIRVVRPTLATWGVSLALAVLNWLADCACLLASFWALGVTVPWQGLLIAYGGAALASSLPITPGGLGVVEGGIALTLVAYGSSMKAALATALLYRVLSFWVMVPLGWTAWGHLSLRRTRARSRAQGLAMPRAPRVRRGPLRDQDPMAVRRDRQCLTTLSSPSL